MEEVMSWNNRGDNKLEKSSQMEHIPYYQEPDYTKSLFEIHSEVREDLFTRLRLLYGEREAKKWMPELERILRVHCAHKPQEMMEAEKDFDPTERFTEKDLVLITYGDLVRGEEHSPLATLYKFVNTHNLGAINTLHILPFFPYSSDRGFAVVDFQQVDQELGTWEDIRHMDWRYDLMFDGVLNHCSSRSRMFREFLNGNPYYKNFFIGYKSPNDLTPDQRSKIFRPRTSDILTKFGPRWVWTTFSEDQIDLNFRNPAVLLRIIEGLLFYVRQGADILRLDAVTYIWAEPGTECVHLPETHEIVKILRDVMDAVAPGVVLVTETNVPHEDNVSYFGNGYDEAHMVYNFALPPLVLYTLYAENATVLSQWAKGARNPSRVATFFNILDTHDGVGLMGVKGILSSQDIDLIIQRAKKHGAYISYKMTEDRTEEPYEINTTWWSALNQDDSDEDMAFQVKRYLASRSIALVLQGVPGVYAHGAIATCNDHELVRKTGHNRDVNRGVIDSKIVVEGFEDPDSKLSHLSRQGSKINLTRTRQRAFHPHGDQRVLMISADIFIVLRTSPEGDQHILTMTNVTSRASEIQISLSELNIKETRWYDLLGEKEWAAESNKISLTLQPYDIIWLIPFTELEKGDVP
jgi:sucrose phosphorylase